MRVSRESGKAPLNMRKRTAAIVVIGNEILNGKSEDQNARFLIGELYQLGVSLRRIVVIPDVLDEIAATVRECSDKFDYVFTSGGVGPTHDDVTIEGVARALGRRVVRSAPLEALIKGYFGPEADEARLRMADAPEDAELVTGPSSSGLSSPPPMSSFCRAFWNSSEASSKLSRRDSGRSPSFRAPCLPAKTSSILRARWGESPPNTPTSR